MKRHFLGPTQSPVVSTTLNRRYREARAASAFRWGSLCVLAALPLLLDLYLHLFSYYSGFRGSAVWYSEVCLLVVLVLSGLYDCVFFSRAALTQTRVKLTPAQRRLLSVKEGLIEGYETVNIPTPFGTPLSPSSLTSPSHISPLALLTPTHHTVTASCNTTHSNHSTPSNTSLSREVISSQQALESYLRAEGEREREATHSSPDVAWSVRQTPDQSSNLRKYHVATSQSPGRDNSSPLVTEDQAVWTELNISREQLIRWTENCRRWLAETVVVPVAKEIATINQILSQGPAPSVTIGAGTGSVSALRRECKTKGPQVPTLHLVLPYLELTAKQGYLVHRITELASGGCLSMYRWNGGGSWKGRPWNQDLPSDPQIVLHLLCTYLDSHLPLSPLSSDRRPFTSQYLVKYPDKPVSKCSDDVAIYQTSLTPPHYNIIFGNRMIEIPRGRSNLFHAVVAMLQHLKTKKRSVLGTTNLAMSSLQILWIVD